MELAVVGSIQIHGLAAILILTELGEDNGGGKKVSRLLN